MKFKGMKFLSEIMKTIQELSTDKGRVVRFWNSEFYNEENYVDFILKM